MKTILFAATALSLSIPIAAQAETPLAEIVVVGARTPQAVDRLGQQVSVVTSETLKARQAVVISDLLATLPGVSVSRNGGIGGVTSVRIRGAETDQTVVLVDGIKLNDPASAGGAYNFANLLAGPVSSIEVLRGSPSTLWGSQAIGGVVNIITTGPTRPLEGVVSLEGGSYGQADGRLSLGGVARGLTWGLSGESFANTGVSAYRGGKEADGYRHQGLSAKVAYDLPGDVRIDLRGLWSRGRVRIDGFPPPNYTFADDPEYGVTESRLGYGGVSFPFGRLKNRLALSQTSTDTDSFDPTQTLTQLTYQTRGDTRRWEYQGVLELASAWQATFGAEREASRSWTAAPSTFDPQPTPAIARTGLTSFYAQAIGDAAPGLTLTGGLRHDRHDAFGNHTLGQVAAAWRLPDGATILRASLSQGFKAPTLYQLFSEYGTSTLRPEAADSGDLGLEHRFEPLALTVAATAFQRQTRDQIDFVSCAFGATSTVCRPNGVSRFGYYDNIARTRAQGVEVTAEARMEALTLSANYTHLRATNQAAGSANHGKLLARRPQHQANLNADYSRTSGLSVGLGVRYVGESFEDAANTYRLKSHVLTDLRMSWPLKAGLEAYGRVENLMDRRYEPTRGYGAPGRGVYLGLRGRF
ncbi:MAG: TonB-dependent receptor [Alphaproteobacteria bacterium PA2]|nr:MAG: TonB-dependent receptor [Alphaproteobacteria bacterium PA2]